MLRWHPPQYVTSKVGIVTISCRSASYSWLTNTLSAWIQKLRHWHQIFRRGIGSVTKRLFLIPKWPKHTFNEHPNRQASIANVNCSHHRDGLFTIHFWTTRLPNGMTKTQESQQHGYGNVVIRQPLAYEMHTKRFLMQNLEGQITNYKTKKHNMKSP